MIRLLARKKKGIASSVLLNHAVDPRIERSRQPQMLPTKRSSPFLSHPFLGSASIAGSSLKRVDSVEITARLPPCVTKNALSQRGSLPGYTQTRLANENVHGGAQQLLLDSISGGKYRET